MALKEVSSNKSFGGFQKVYSHESKEVGCVMKFGVYLPPQAEERKLPVIYWLSGLTCSEANFIEKAGAQRYAAEHGIIIVNPDTSPRGLNIPGDKDSYDFGEGAGFYLNATQEPWKKNYRMYSYVTGELMNLVNANFPVVEGNQSIMGHSMGGHGAMICALKNPGLYKSVSAFAPLCNPSTTPWGNKALTGYLGPKETANWAEWDATELVKKYNGPPLELFIDQVCSVLYVFFSMGSAVRLVIGRFYCGLYTSPFNSTAAWICSLNESLIIEIPSPKISTAACFRGNTVYANRGKSLIRFEKHNPNFQGMEDQFLHELKPENLIEACRGHVRAILKKREGYNHSYFYVASFMSEHVAYHAEHLNK